jgi:HAD superfamily hydrolase (TIGR01509 family)
MRRFDLAVFDMDGVLTDSSGCHARAFDDLWSRLGVDGPPYASIAGRTTAAVLTESTVHLRPTPADIADWVRFKQTRAREYLRGVTTGYADVAPALQRLQQHPVRLAIGTGASLETTRLLLAQLGIAHLFPVIVTAEDVRAGKPAPDTFTLAMERSLCAADRTLVIEDSLSGLEAGAAAGAYVASVRTGERLAHQRFLGSFPDLTGLLDHLGVAAA